MLLKVSKCVPLSLTGTAKDLMCVLDVRADLLSLSLLTAHWGLHFIRISCVHPDHRAHQSPPQLNNSSPQTAEAQSRRRLSVVRDSVREQVCKQPNSDQREQRELMDSQHSFLSELKQARLTPTLYLSDMFHENNIFLWERRQLSITNYFLLFSRSNNCKSDHVIRSKEKNRVLVHASEFSRVCGQSQSDCKQ